MSKFCTSCGSQIPDGASNCPGCGVSVIPVASNPAPTPVAPVTATYQQPMANPTVSNPAAPNPKSKSTMIGVISVAVIAILVIVLLVNIFGGGGYKKAISTMVDGMEKADWDKYSSVLLKEERKTMESWTDGDDIMDMMMESFEDDYGKNIKISYKIKDKEKLDKDDIEDLEDEYDDTYGKKIDIEKAYTLEVEMTIKGKDDKDTDTDDMTVVEVDSDWYVLQNID